MIERPNRHQDMYYLYDYKLSTTWPEYNDITIETKWGETKLIIQIPNGKKFYEELTKEMNKKV